jgi:hypothetical protein
MKGDDDCSSNRDKFNKRIVLGLSLAPTPRNIGEPCEAMASDCDRSNASGNVGTTLNERFVKPFSQINESFNTNP